MGKTIKDLLKSTVISIGMALTIFSLIGMFFDITNGGNFSLEGYQFTKMVIGSAIVGIGFGVPTLVYNSEKLPTPVKVLIHMGTGCVIYTIVGQGFAIAAIQLLVAFVIWFCFMRYYRKEARQMNDKIQSMKNK